MSKETQKTRCPWVGNSEKMIVYHDTVWGKPEYRDKEIFKAIILDTFQAGLSWAIILNKRENFGRAFANFDPKRVAMFTKKDVSRLLKDSGIIRNRLKIEAAITNARAFLEVQKEFGAPARKYPDGFSKYIWGFVGGKPIVNKRKKMSDYPAKTALAEKISKDMKKRGFKFVGPTVVYAFMQGIGMVNDHTVSCFRYGEVQ